jgi:hypothetical protein
MKRKVNFLLISVIIITISSCEKNIELVPGEMCDEGACTYYQEYDIGLGDNTIEGYFDLSNLENKTKEEGFPVFEICFDVSKRYFQGDTLEIIEPVKLHENDNFSIAVNIETGYYALKGLPNIDEGQDMLIRIGNAFWVISGDVINIFKEYSSEIWNSQTVFSMPNATYFPEDPSISMTVNFNYMVDDYWLENGEFENGATQGSYTEMNFSELSAIASVRHEQYNSGLGMGRDIGGVEYGVNYEMSISDFQAQSITFGGISGGEYTSLSMSVLVNNELYRGEAELPNGVLSLHSGDSHTETIDIYIPQLGENK